MERLTKMNSQGSWCVDQEKAYRGHTYCIYSFGEAIDRLATYEDTGLTPEEIASALAELAQYKADEVAGLFVKTCTWSQDDPDVSVWECSNCDCVWSFEEGGVIENNTNYCPECGAKITHLTFKEVDYETCKRIEKTLTRDAAAAALKGEAK